MNLQFEFGIVLTLSKGQKNHEMEFHSLLLLSDPVCPEMSSKMTGIMVGFESILTHTRSKVHLFYQSRPETCAISLVGFATH